MLGTIMVVSVLLDFNVNLHEGEDHVENRVDAREDVPRAAANRHLRDLKTVEKSPQRSGQIPILCISGCQDQKQSPPAWEIISHTSDFLESKLE